MLELLRAKEAPEQPSTDVYVLHQGDAAARLAMRVAEGLRTVGLDVVLHCAGPTGIGSFKSQMKRADASGAAFAVILGDDEVAAGEATVRSLDRGPDGRGGDQRRVPLDALAVTLVDALVGDDALLDDEPPDDASADDERLTRDADDAKPGTLH
jgi:histidyl-tRNA synthetase